MTDDVDRALDRLGLHVFDDETKRQVEEVLAGGQTVEPDARRKLVDAAQRALRVRATNQGPFEVLAFETRIAGHVDIAKLAEDVGSTADSLRAIERGERALLDQEPELIARWIRNLGLDDELGLASVTRSLRTAAPGHAYAEKAPPDRPDGASARLIERIREALASLPRTVLS